MHSGKVTSISLLKILFQCHVSGGEVLTLQFTDAVMAHHITDKDSINPCQSYEEILKIDSFLLNIFEHFISSWH